MMLLPYLYQQTLYHQQTLRFNYLYQSLYHLWTRLTDLVPGQSPGVHHSLLCGQALATNFLSMYIQYHWCRKNLICKLSICRVLYEMPFRLNIYFFRELWIHAYVQYIVVTLMKETVKSTNKFNFSSEMLLKIAETSTTGNFSYKHSFCLCSWIILNVLGEKWDTWCCVYFGTLQLCNE